jgi:hypothetical protein
MWRVPCTLVVYSRVQALYPAPTPRLLTCAVSHRAITRAAGGRRRRRCSPDVTPPSAPCTRCTLEDNGTSTAVEYRALYASLVAYGVPGVVGARPLARLRQLPERGTGARVQAARPRGST